MTFDRRLLIDDSWWTIDGRFSMDDSRWTILNGRFSIDDSRWTILDGQLSMDDSRKTILGGRLWQCYLEDQVIMPFGFPTHRQLPRPRQSRSIGWCSISLLRRLAQGVRMEDGRIETFKTWPNQNQYKIFKYSIGVSSRVQQDHRSTHLDAQNELINWIIRKLDPDSGWGRWRCNLYLNLGPRVA